MKFNRLWLAMLDAIRNRIETHVDYVKERLPNGKVRAKPGTVIMLQLDRLTGETLLARDKDNTLICHYETGEIWLAPHQEWSHAQRTSHPYP